MEVCAMPQPLIKKACQKLVKSAANCSSGIRMIGVEAGKLPVLSYMLDENLKVAIPSPVEFALPMVDMPAGNVLQKNDPGGGQLTILELLTPNVNTSIP